MLQPVPLLARLAEEAYPMKLAPGVLLLPLLNPVEVAENVATLDVVSEGRAVMGVGMGYRQEENEAFGSPAKERVSRFLECLQVVLRLWTGEPFTHEGRHFQLHNAVGTTLPVQRPHPPIWVAANNDQAVARAGRLGYPWLMNPHATLDMLGRQMGVFRQALASAEHPFPEEVPLLRELHVGATHDQALRVARPLLASKYGAYQAWGQDRAMPGHERFDTPFEELARGRFIVGDVQEVTHQLEECRQRLGATLVIFRLQWPGMDNRHVLSAIELLGKHVVPAFQKRSAHSP